MQTTSLCVLHCTNPNWQPKILPTGPTTERPLKFPSKILLISSDVLAVVSAVVPKSGWQGQHFWRFCRLATNVGLVQEAWGQGLHRSRSQGRSEHLSDRESLSSAREEGWQGPLYVDWLDCCDSGWEVSTCLNNQWWFFGDFCLKRLPKWWLKRSFRCQLPQWYFNTERENYALRKYYHPYERFHARGSLRWSP